MPNITIYTTPTCSFCKMAKQFFKDNDIEYSELDVTQDQDARNVMIQKSGQLGVPVIDIDGQIIVGFNKERISELISA